MRSRLSAPFVLVSLCAVALAGCPGRLANPEDFVGATSDGAPATCTLGVSAVEAQLIHPRCATANCHDRSGHAGGLDLESPDVASRLLGVRSAMCSGRVLADMNSPASGYFVEKLAGTPSCGGRMPLAAPALTAGELTCVRAWLSSLGPDASAPMDVPRDTSIDATADVRDVATDLSDVANDLAVDVRDASDVTDASDASDANDVTDASDASIDARDASDVTDASDASVDAARDASSDATDVTDASDVTEASDTTDASSDVSDVADAE